MAAGYRIGEVADATGFPPSTLRYYEDLGLLPPPERSSAGQRLYSDAHVERLRVMSQGKQLGLSLDEVAGLAEAWDHEPCSATRSHLNALLDAKLREVRDQIAELTRFADELAAVVEDVTRRRVQPGRCGSECGCAPALVEQVSTEPPERPFGALPLADSS